MMAAGKGKEGGQLGFKLFNTSVFMLRAAHKMVSNFLDLEVKNILFVFRTVGGHLM